ncbi:hypothetical protein BKA83DRAFT_4119885 [Pisolithus microcarpus]|nr:hypothetical protein BKA83DRAFT_4119885 [Pisolithus microcarpus]
MLHYHSGCEILVTPSTLPGESTDDPRNKGKSKAQESEVASGDGNINENSDLIQVSMSIDNAIIIPPSTLQLLKERGYDVSVSNHVQVAHGPAVGAEGPVRAVNFPSGHLMVLSEDGPWEVWITSGPSKGCRGMLRTPLDFTRMAAFIVLCWRLFAEIAPPPCHATPPPSLSAVDPLAKPGSSCIPWLFDDDFCNYPRWHICLRVTVSYNHGSLHKQIVCTMVPDHFLTVMQEHGCAPPGHLSVTMTSSMLWPILPHTTGRAYWPNFLGQKMSNKKEQRGVELDDSTKLQFRDIYYVGLAVKMYMGDNILHSF